MAEPLWRWPELCAALGLPAVAGPDVSGISIDSRTLRPGDLFIALPGDPGPRFHASQVSDRDGHDFIDAALTAGAVGVLTHDPARRHCPELKVRDTLEGLWSLGRAARARLDGPVVAVTGSSGKTTAKSFLAAALGAFTTPGSLNNHLGVPLSLALTPREAPAGVYEIGTSHPGEIGPLSRLVQPTVAVLLNVHQAHRANFPDQESLIKEKTNIIKGLNDHSSFIVEDRVPFEPPPALRVIRFGESPTADVQLLGLEGDRGEYRFGGRRVEARVPGGGRHRALTLAAVLGVHLALDADPAPALELPGDLVPPGRGNRIEVAGVTILDDSYNANPESMKAALTALAAEPGRRRIAVIGEMLELGELAETAHRALAVHLRLLDRVFGVGTGMRPVLADLGVQASYFPVADQSLIETLVRELSPGDVVLVKGSNRLFWTRNFVGQLTGALTS